MSVMSLELAARAAGFAMVPSDDAADFAVSAAPADGDTAQSEFVQAEFVQVQPLDTARPARIVDRATLLARWQGSSEPVASANARSGGIADWLPSFSWRATA